MKIKIKINNKNNNKKKMKKLQICDIDNKFILRVLF